MIQFGTIKTNLCSFPAIKIIGIGTWIKFADWSWRRVVNWEDVVWERLQKTNLDKTEIFDILPHMKKITVDIRRSSGGVYKIERITNAIEVFVGIQPFHVDSVLSKVEAEKLCLEKKYDVTVKGTHV